MPLVPAVDVQASFLKETIVKRERTGGVRLVRLIGIVMTNVVLEQNRLGS